MLKIIDSHCVKSVQYGVISGPYFLVFSPNTGKYGPEIIPYLDTFHAVFVFKVLILLGPTHIYHIGSIVKISPQYKGAFKLKGIVLPA